MEKLLLPVVAVQAVQTDVVVVIVVLVVTRGNTDICEEVVEFVIIIGRKFDELEEKTPGSNWILSVEFDEINFTTVLSFSPCIM